MTGNSRIIDFLTRLGLSQYEARAYLALLSMGRASSYAIAKAAAMPSSKVYHVIQKLERRGMVVRLGNASRRSRLYSAISGKKFVADFLARQQDTGKELVDALEHISKGTDDQLIWNLEGWEEIQSRALQLIAGTRKHLLVSGWPEEIASLLEPLQAAHHRECQVALVHYGPAPLPLPFATYLHRQEKIVAAERSGRTLCITADRSSALIAHIPNDGVASAGYSHNRTFVGVTEEFIRHDIYFLKVMKRFGAELVRRFGRDLRDLRDPFADRERKRFRPNQRT